jgi:hypothetical protein
VIKDPQDGRRTPYEVLGITPDTPVRELQAALVRAVRAKANIAEAQAALVWLRSLPERAAVDIWYYEIGADVTVAPARPLDFAEFLEPPLAEHDELYADLDTREFAAQLPPIEVFEPKFTAPAGLVESPAVLLEPEFDR